MNIPAISRDEILNAAESLLSRDEQQSLNMRALARGCNISVGCVYNYFPSKADLIFALMERFSDALIQNEASGQEDTSGFVETVCSLHKRMLVGFHAFSAGFLQEASAFSARDRRTGKQMEARCFAAIKENLHLALTRDSRIQPSAWTDAFTATTLVDFVFDNILNSVRQGNADCNMLAQLIVRSIYQ